MKHFNTKAIAALVLAAAGATAAYAVPAKQGIRDWQLPDGTILKVQVVGDEHHHVYLSEDNYLLVREDGYFYFADMDDNSEIYATRYRAANVGDRDAATRAFLAALDPRDMLHSMEVAGSEARANFYRIGPGTFTGTSFPRTGHQKVLVLLVDFQDRAFTLSNPNEYFHRMLNEPGFSGSYGTGSYSGSYGTGSAREYFNASSMGQFDPEFDVFGPVTMPQGYAYYGAPSASGGNDSHVAEMVISACQMLDDQIDFSQYDRDNNGVIDNVYLYYAGQGEATCTDPNTIWPHASNITGNYTFDGKRLSRYSCSNEWEGAATSGRPDGPGTTCHEFSHVLGLPDLYSTNYTGAFTPGDWDVMDNACYNNNGYTPALYSAQERYALGWLEPTEITGEMNGRLNPLATSNEAYIITTNKSNEYFLLENRQQTGWDRFLPGHGMLVWHIDFNQSLWDRNGVNNNNNHQYADIEEADNVKTDATRSGDPFPGTAKVTSFTDDTTPSMKSWAGTKRNLPITDIKEELPSMAVTFKVSGGAAPAQSTTASAATDVTPRSFKAHWNSVNGAKAYRLSVYSTDAQGVKTYAPGYDMRDMGANTEAVVSGLEPSTAYVYSVVVETAQSSSNPSNEIGVNTLALTHEYLIPVAKPATEIGETSFTANWEEVAGAEDYRLDVWSRKVTGAVTDTEGFDGKKSTWFFAYPEYYSTKNYSGTAVPSAKLTGGNLVCSPVVSGKIHSFSFWNRGGRQSPTLAVEAYVDGTWMPLVFMEATRTNGGAVTEINNIPEGASAMRVAAYSDDSSDVVYIDDLQMVSGGSVTTATVASGMSAGNALSKEVGSLNAGTEYFYTVKAVKGGVASMASAPEHVLTDGVSGIETVDSDKAGVTVEGDMIAVEAAAEAKVLVADLNGRVLFRGVGAVKVRVAPGAVYFVSVDGKSAKVLVK